MINFNWNHYKSSGTPDIGGNYIAMLAEKLLADYKPSFCESRVKLTILTLLNHTLMLSLNIMIFIMMKVLSRL